MMNTTPTNAEIDCPRCGVVMTKGIAMVGAPRGITCEGKWPARLQDCLKCHSCGHSETIQPQEVEH